MEYKTRVCSTSLLMAGVNLQSEQFTVFKPNRNNVSMYAALAPMHIECHSRK